MIHRSYDELVDRLFAIAEHPSVQMEEIGAYEAAGKAYPLYVVHLGRPNRDKLSVCLSAGIHGDEPAGVEAVVKFLEEHASNVSLLAKAYFVIFPCDNPYGWENNTRENADGIDLNRQFAVSQPPPEVALITKALEGRCFDLVCEMHEDVDSAGFYLYELVDEQNKRVGDTIVQLLSLSGVPINLAHIIEGTKAECGVIRPGSMKNFRKTHLPKAVYTYRTCGGHVITLEPPAARLPLEERVRIELAGLCYALEKALEQPRD